MQVCVSNCLGGGRLNVGLGKLMEGVLAAFAQSDNDVRSDRTRAGMRAALRRKLSPYREGSFTIRPSVRKRR